MSAYEEEYHEPESPENKKVGLPCPHGRLPNGEVDGWRNCPHCLGLNNIIPVKIK